MRISKREAFLLFFLALMSVVGLLVVLVILPLQNEIEIKQTELSSLQDQRFMIETTLPTAKSLKERIAVKETEVSEMLAKVETPLNEAQFDRKILALTTKYNMLVLNTENEGLQVVPPKGLERLPLNPVYDIKSLIQEYKNLSSEEYGIFQSDYLLLFNHFDYELKTTYARFIFLLDDIRDLNTSVFVRTAEYDYEEGIAKLGIDVYMVEQFDNSDDTDYTTDLKAGGTGAGKKGENPHPEGGK